MSDTLQGGPIPQFGTAEYHERPGGDRCKTCGQAIPGQFFRVSGNVACPACAEKIVGQLPKDTHKALGRGVLFGVCGAVLGLILYSTVGIVTGFQIGYVSLAVGYLVGRAIMMGSWGIGGRRYQIAALALTYAAVSISAVPIGISQMIKEANSGQAKEQAVVTGSDGTLAESSSQGSQMSFGTGFAYLALLGLASPFLELAEPVSGLIGLVILFVGLKIAWRMTAGAEIEIRGPYNN